MAYIGKIKERMDLSVTLTNEYIYNSYYGYMKSFHIYIMKDEYENVFVWKTGTVIGLDRDDGEFIPINKGDTIKIKGTIKEHSEYKGIEQTVLTRVKVQDILKKALTRTEKVAIKRKKQLESIRDNDFVYEMPYRQYKQHYSDCETLAGSYNNRERTICVIVREGRLKPSGVRFRKFSNYMFGNNANERRCIYAVSVENAWKRLEKEKNGAEGWFFIEEIR